MNSQVPILFTRRKSVYSTIPGCDLWDAKRDVRNFKGKSAVVAHPPCRAWGKLSHFAKPVPGEIDLATIAATICRTNGGVLEHPRTSRLWKTLGLHKPFQRDAFGGYCISMPQIWFGHPAEKATWFYIVGIMPADLPEVPFTLATPEREIEKMCTAQRERTPLLLASWLVEVARRIERNK